ncbi:hypothetical protein WMY93_008826 [Mugilogobius chulae]|uniref:Uncharacterized protein n=1 Tax=Mugilogobius chulae TaxID=88201 RepID=A0AAW0PG75_9GOBI
MRHLDVDVDTAHLLPLSWKHVEVNKPPAGSGASELFPLVQLGLSNFNEFFPSCGTVQRTMIGSPLSCKSWPEQERGERLSISVCDLQSFRGRCYRSLRGANADLRADLVQVDWPDNAPGE